jgi:hypothetical protein
MVSFRTLIATLFLLATANAFFVPATKKCDHVTASSSKTSLAFGFLKDLGIEKPSWLPDFGGKKEEKPVPAAEESSDEGDEAESEPVEKE